METWLSSHSPVLLRESVDLLNPHPAGRFIDCTVNGGGHSAAILDRTAPDGEVLALDADPSAIELARSRLAPYGARTHLVQSNFRMVGTVARDDGFIDVDGVLMDLGFSSNQIEHSGRGFSFNRDEPLDMRFDPSEGESAAEILATAQRDAIAHALWSLGDEQRSRRIADAIVAAREREPLTTTAQLAHLVSSAIGGRSGRLHPATKTFQALRILVNDELGALRAALPQALSLLRSGGRLAVISFHSLEDRIVKAFFRTEAGLDPDESPRGLPVSPDRPLPRVRIITRRPVSSSAEEIALNPRSRSARLRVAERI